MTFRDASTPPIYLDNAATTPVRPEVREALEPFFTDALFGNPASAHQFGRAARAAVEKARRRLAAALGVEPREIVFTSGGTEADNLAIIGAALAARRAGRPFRVAVSAVEHKGVLAAAHAVEDLGGEALILPVDAAGQVDLAAVDRALERGVAVVSVMWVNNEVGTIQNVATVAERCRAAGTPFHSDAVQAVGKIPCEIAGLPIDMLTISGHKLGAPKGIGALVIRDRDTVWPLMHGGGQQEGVRPGTENVAGSVGLGLAVELALTELRESAEHTRRLRDELERRVPVAVPDVVINGTNAARAPHISNMSFPGTDSESLVMHLDLLGIACSSGSACTSGAAVPSHVLTAMGVPAALGMASLRFSFSRHNGDADVVRVADALPDVVSRIRRLETELERA